MLSGLIWWLFVGLVAGWAAGKIMKGGGYGTIVDIVLGIAGAVVGGFLLGFLNLGGGLIMSIIVATIGACLLVWLTRLIKK